MLTSGVKAAPNCDPCCTNVMTKWRMITFTWDLRTLATGLSHKLASSITRNATYVVGISLPSTTECLQSSYRPPST